VVHLRPETFVLAFNIRALALVLTTFCFFIQVNGFRKGIFIRGSRLRKYLMRVMMVILIFTFITSETHDYFSKRLSA
jgi:hypothetical protein